MAVKSTPVLNAFYLFVFLLVLACLLMAALPHGSRMPERRVRDTDENAQTISVASAKADVKQKASEAYGRLALSFEENRGQAEASVDFAARGPGYNLALSPTEAAFALNRQSSPSDTRGLSTAQEEKSNIAATILRMKLVGANQSAKVAGRNKLEGTVNYFIGNDPSKWQTGISTFAKVRYSEVYPGIDIEYYGNHKQLEYDFVLAPGRDPSAIELEFAGAQGVEIEAATGDLLVRVKEDTIRQHAPITYQETASGERKEIESRYALREGGKVAFEVGVYDQSAPLVIDPVLQYSTYLGAGSGTEAGSSIAIDSAGNAYVTGNTTSTNFPTASANDSTPNGASDVFVTKINAAGTAVLYSTYLGGSSSDGGEGIVLDSAGNVYVAVFTTSTDFPMINAIDTTHNGGGDVVVMKINTTGTALVYSTYQGGANYDEVASIAVDSAGNAYVVGYTLSPNFPTVNPIDGTFGGGALISDAFVTKINAAGTAVAYSTYLGGSSSDGARHIAVDSAGNAYVTGKTSSNNFPTVNPIQATLLGTSDAFVTKINAAGTALAYSTYLGGNDDDGAQGIAVDSAGNAYVAGETSSTNFPTLNPIDSTGSDADAFVTKINTAGTLVYSTYLGGEGGAFAFGIAVDSAGNAYVAGYTFGSGFPTVNPIAGMHDDGDEFTDDGFVTKINAAGGALIYSTYLGGNTDDVPNAIAVDSAGNAYVTGFTNSACFPTTVGAFDTTFNGSNTSTGGDAFISKISETASPSPLTLTACETTLQFSMPIFSVTEEVAEVSITLLRSGNLSSAVTVDFVTSDATALQRTDYTIGAGTVRWAAGDGSSKSFRVLITEDAYAENSESLNLTLSNPIGASLGAQSTATLTILDDDATNPPTVQPIEDANIFVRQHYHDMLAREGDSGGIAYWTNEITQCGSNATCIRLRRLGVSNAFFFEPEFQETAAYLYRVYKVSFNAFPSYTPFMRDRSRVVGGVMLDADKNAFNEAFVLRAAFLALFPLSMTPAQYVDALNANTNNALTPAQRDALVNGLTASTETRGTVLRKVAENSVFIDQEYNNAFVVNLYFGYLRRDPEPGGFNFWLTQINSAPLRNVPKQQALVCSFITSQEYQERFSSVVTRTNAECAP